MGGKGKEKYRGNIIAVSQVPCCLPGTVLQDEANKLLLDSVNWSFVPESQVFVLFFKAQVS